MSVSKRNNSASGAGPETNILDIEFRNRVIDDLRDLQLSFRRCGATSRAEDQRLRWALVCLVMENACVAALLEAAQ
jgi:hypothetical protein